MSGKRKVCVYCASSSKCSPQYHEAAFRLGCVLADNNFSIVYGGGGLGSMGALADGAISRDGHIIGVLPKFMQELEWGHSALSELLLVEDLRTRKHLMVTGSDAVVALPGGSGTLEELLETISLKRLGLYLNPIILVNTRGFFDPLIQLLTSAIDEGFMDKRHSELWSVVAVPEDVVEAINTAHSWPADAQSFATRRPAQP